MFPSGVSYHGDNPIARRDAIAASKPGKAAIPIRWTNKSRYIRLLVR